MIERTCAWIEQKTEGKLTGTPVDRLLLIRGISTDTRKMKPGSLFVPLIGDRFDGHDFLDQAIEAGAVAALWQSDHPYPKQDKIPLIFVSDTLKALQQIASAYREELGIPIIAITGSNGKTTTKDLVSSVLSVKFQVDQTEGNLNNHIGVPLTLCSMSEHTQVGVVEMGMNHAGEIAILSKIAKPNFAVITNVGESHLEYLGSREGIANAKLEIIEGLDSKGTFIVHGDEPLLLQKLSEIKQKVIRIGFGEENDEFPQKIEAEDLSGIRFHTSSFSTHFEVPLLGKHNILNALFAIQLGRLFKLMESEIQKGLEQAKITGKRLEMTRARNGMFIINDAYNASPTSMKAAIDLQHAVKSGLDKWVLFGDMREIGRQEERYHREIGAYAVSKDIKRIYTIGEKGRWIAEGAREMNRDSSCIIKHFESHEEVIDHLQKEGGRNVLLLVKASLAMHLDKVVQKLK